MGNVNIIKILTYDLETSPGFSNAKFMTEEELKKERIEKIREDRKKKLERIKNISLSQDSF